MTDTNPEAETPSLTSTFSTASIIDALRLPALALFTALVASAVIIIVSDVDNLERLGSEPGGAIGDILSTLGDAFWALLNGSFGSLRAISETFTNATPLIFAGLAVGFAFQAGLFNIGAAGQMVLGGIFAIIVATNVDAPAVILLPLGIIAGFIGGFLWGAIPGLLRARTGAHEVITTIMLNSVGGLLLIWFLGQEFIQEEGRNDPISAVADESGRFPRLLGFLDRPELRVSTSLLLALALVWVVWWILFRSTIGFELRVTGQNATAAGYGGASVTRSITLALAISGGLAGLAGTTQVIGLPPFRATPGFVGDIGFDAISIALLGRAHPAGILASAILFGALRAGGQEMQVVTDVPIDMILVVQAFVVIFIAAPALIRSLYRLDRGETAEAAA